MYRRQNAVSNFLEDILWEEEEIRKILAVPEKIKMTPGDWEKFKPASDYHIRGKGLVKEEFLYSLRFATRRRIDDYHYWGQSHKRCYYTEKKIGFLPNKNTKKLTEQADKKWQRN